MLASKNVLSGCILAFSTGALVKDAYSTHSWAVVSLCTWLLFFISLRGQPTKQDKQQAAWGCLSIAAFAHFLWRHPSFTSWSDVYFFCGPNLEFCSCNLDWNTEGWMKAIVLWNFVLSSTLALQKLLIEVGLQGLLPGQSC